MFNLLITLFCFILKAIRFVIMNLNVCPLNNSIYGWICCLFVFNRAFSSILWSRFWLHDKDLDNFKRNAEAKTTMAQKPMLLLSQYVNYIVTFMGFCMIICSEQCGAWYFDSSIVWQSGWH